MDSRAQDPTAPGPNPAAASSADTRFEPDAAVADEQSPSEAFHTAQIRLSELAEYISYYFSAKTDGIKLSLRKVVIFAALAVVVLSVLGATISIAVVLLCTGIAGGLGALLGHHLWLGSLVTGILLLGLIGGVIYSALGRIGQRSREGTVKKYAARQQQQRAKFGQDVRQRAGSPAQ